MIYNRGMEHNLFLHYSHPFIAAPTTLVCIADFGYQFVLEY